MIMKRKRSRSANRVYEENEEKARRWTTIRLRSRARRSGRSGREQRRGRVGRIAAHFALINTDESDRSLRVSPRGGSGENTEEGQLSAQTRFLHSRMRLCHTSDAKEFVGEENKPDVAKCSCDVVGRPTCLL